MKTIGLFWHTFKSNNLGVSALSDANIEIIMQSLGTREIKFVLFGPNGKGSFEAPRIQAELKYVSVSSIFSITKILKEIRECDYLFDIGAGDSFSDIYGWKRFTKISSTKILTAICNKKLILSPQTIGPYKSSIAQLIAMIGLKCADHIFVRDKVSEKRALDLLGERGGSKVTLTTDVAFALPTVSSWPNTFPARDSQKIRIGINVSGLLFEGGYNKNNQFGLTLNYKQFIIELLTYYSTINEYEIWLIPHVYNGEIIIPECDLQASLKLKEIFKNLNLAPKFNDAREAKTFIHSMDVMLAARMHAAIAAVSGGTACIPLSYSTKFEGLFESILYPHTLNMKEVTQEDALECCKSLMDQIPKLKNDALNSKTIAQKQLSVYAKGLCRILND